MNGSAHFLHKGGNSFRALSAMFRDDADNGGADNRAVGKRSHPRGLLRGRDAEADGTRQISHCPDLADQGSDIGIDLTPDAGDAKRGNHIEESLRLFGDHADALL